MEILDYLYSSEVAKEYSPWVETGESDWSCLTSNMKPKRFKKDTLIYQQQEDTQYVYLVESGRVRLSVYSVDGEEKSLFIAEKGCLFGEISCLDSIPNFANATVAADSLIYEIPKQAFMDTLNNNQLCALNVISLLNRKIRILSNQIKQLSFDDSYYRVCNALIHLTKQYGIKGAAGYRLNIKFTHQEMANLIGLNRVTVTNIFISMTNKGILTKENGHYLIKNMDMLHNYISSNPKMKRQAFGDNPFESTDKSEK
ncbi:MAG: Crp/Fnr family transcriptional regulator [Clostridia bacterium]